jgi:beta-1,4-mannosyl-glycoprotein beta-1,4-N-acetylglucosaminyltransferase
MPYARIIDAFLFDSEISLLEHRLAETYDLIDLFVLVEAGETFQGKAKAMTFGSQRDRFSKYAAKIRHVALPHLAVPAPGGAVDPWDRERFQRDAILFALPDAREDDMLLLLDADEIPSRELLIRLRRDGLDTPRRLLMTRHYEGADLLGPRSACCPCTSLPFPFALGRKIPPSWQTLRIEWFSRAGVALPFGALLLSDSSSRRSPFDVRRTTPLAGALPNAGRHLCFLDPSARPSRKLGRAAHAELATDRGQASEHLLRCTRYGVHHRGWWYAERPSGALPEDLLRLIDRCPEIQSGQQIQPILLRHIVRTWAWLRCSEIIPKSIVQSVDRHMTLWALILAPWLLAIDIGRALCALVSARLKGVLANEPRHFDL